MKIIDTGTASAEENMALDQRLLTEMASTPLSGRQPMLHLYDWSGPSATYGYFIRPDTLIDMEAAEKAQLQLAKRPTGGGMIFHLTDFAFSFIIPANHAGYHVNTLDNYAFINRMVIDAIKQLMGSNLQLQLLQKEPIPTTPQAQHFCMAKPTKYDVMLEGRKVGGAAQRRMAHAFLHQGTISLGPPDWTLLRQVLSPQGVWEAMQANTHCLLGHPQAHEIKSAREGLKKILSGLEI